LASAAIANLPVAHEISRKVLCLPIYPYLSDEQLLFIVDIIKGKS